MDFNFTGDLDKHYAMIGYVITRFEASYFEIDIAIYRNFVYYGTEYMAMIEVVKEAIWFQESIDNFGFVQGNVIVH